jgi:hypothetical protein
MSIIGSIRAEWTEEAVNRFIRELSVIDISELQRQQIIRLLHKCFDGLCLE